MSETLLRARSSTEIVDAAVQLLRRHYASLVVVSGIGMIPLLVLQPFASRLIGTSEATTPEAVMQDISFGGIFLVNMISAICYWLASAAIITAAAQAYREGHLDVADAIRQVFNRIGAVVYAALVKGFLIGIGLLMLLVGGAYFYATYFAVPTTIMIEKLSGNEGLKRSRQLATGNRWHVLKTMLLVLLVYLVISLGVGAIGGMFLGGSAIVTNVFTMLITILVYPIMPITEMLLYFDLRIRTEGYDVEVMASQLDTSVTPPAR